MNEPGRFFWQHIEKSLRQQVTPGFCLQKVVFVHGGDINDSFKVSGDDECYFLKVNSSENIDMFVAEAEGLNVIAATSSFISPKVICSGVHQNYSFLLLEYFDLVNHGSNIRLADSLVKLHQPVNKQFGLPHDNFIGSSQQANKQSDNWIQFFGEQRLGFQLKLLKNKYACSRLQAKAERLIENLDRFFDGYSPQVSLVHGDLWQGNYAFNAKGEPVIYDPACYYADREVDLAMMELFGSPEKQFFQRYHEKFPIDAGYVNRKPLYNLYHLLNHANLFGANYLTRSELVIEKLLST